MPTLLLSAPLLHALQTQHIEFPLPRVLSAQLCQTLCLRLNCNITELAQQLLPYAGSLSVAPHSHFSVGAIAIDQQGALYFGANFESEHAALTASLHAEQSAIINALLHQSAEIVSLVINAKPCGYCRQFLQELKHAKQLTIIVDRQRWNLAELLPGAFSPHDLGLSEGLNLLSLTGQTGKDYAEASYSPYSSVKSAILAYSGQQCLAWSCYIENAAYNPSVSPLLSLQGQLALRASPLPIHRLALWERETNRFSFSKELAAFAKQQPHIDIEFNYYL